MEKARRPDEAKEAAGWEETRLEQAPEGNAFVLHAEKKYPISQEHPAMR